MPAAFRAAKCRARVASWARLRPSSLGSLNLRARRIRVTRTKPGLRAGSLRVNLTKADAYALCSIAGAFRVTQVVDIERGVHAMIPKSLFAPDLRKQVTVV